MYLLFLMRTLFKDVTQSTSLLYSLFVPTDMSSCVVSYYKNKEENDDVLYIPYVGIQKIKRYFNSFYNYIITAEKIRLTTHKQIHTYMQVFTHVII